MKILMPYTRPRVEQDAPICKLSGDILREIVSLDARENPYREAERLVRILHVCTQWREAITPLLAHLSGKLDVQKADTSLFSCFRKVKPHSVVLKACKSHHEELHSIMQFCGIKPAKRSFEELALRASQLIYKIATKGGISYEENRGALIGRILELEPDLSALYGKSTNRRISFERLIRNCFMKGVVLPSSWFKCKGLPTWSGFQLMRFLISSVVRAGHVATHSCIATHEANFRKLHIHGDVAAVIKLVNPELSDCDERGMDALTLARYAGRTEMETILLEHGAEDSPEKQVSPNPRIARTYLA